jgi:hypothetical protein
LSSYRSSGGVTFWIITEAGRSTTNVEFHISRVELNR